MKELIKMMATLYGLVFFFVVVIACGLAVGTALFFGLVSLF